MTKKIVSSRTQYSQSGGTVNITILALDGNSVPATEVAVFQDASITAVIHEGPHEKVYTKSEVLDAIERRIEALPDTLAVADYQRIRDVLTYLDPE
jgi:hypothetical protein